MKNLIKKIIKKRQEKIQKKCQAMKSEIICAIAYQVRKKQATEKVSIPAFLEVQSIYDSLFIENYKDTANVYRFFYNKGLVSGINL